MCWGSYGHDLIGFIMVDTLWYDAEGGEWVVNGN